MTVTSGSFFNPFPGLRPFRETEAHLFFGRGEQTDKLLAELERSRFVAVMGSSGSGKSSLVAAGLLPALHGGFSVRVGSHWRIAMFGPGGNPIHNLAQALTVPDVLGPGDADPLVAAARIEATLRRSGFGLADLARRDNRLRDSRLLVVVDQFEELFRFQGIPGDEGGQREGSAFVQLLIEATRDDAPVDVIVTMRSDFLGDCSQFRELPETINQGLYLVPRLKRSQLAEAITAPAAVGGGAIAPRLVQRLLNDAGADPDVLPLLQHALMRTWDLWAQNGEPAGPIDLEHYEAGGGIEEALSRHADEAYQELADDKHRKIAELMFRRLTELGVDGRETRHPTPLAEIAAVGDATAEELSEVVGTFEQQGRSFVTVSADEVVDISHESLIRQWRRLRGWVGDEARSRGVYRRLANAADRWERGEAALLRNPDLQISANWWKDNQPNQAWADRYNPAFRRAADYLKRSQRAAAWRRIWALAGVAALAVLAVLSTFFALQAQLQQRISVSRELAAVSVDQGAELRVQSILTAVEALQATEVDGLRIPVAEQALRSALRDPLGLRLPSRPDQLGHEGQVNTLAFSPDRRWLATGDDDGTALVWRLEDLEADPIPLDGHEDDITAMAFSPDGRWLATGSNDDIALLWSLDGLEADPIPLDGHEDDITAMAFSPDGRWLATGSNDTTALLWSLDDLEAEPIPLEGHSGFVLALTFSPDGKWLATGSGDETALLWSLEDPNAEPTPLDGHEDDIVTLAFRPDGEFIATGSRDSTVRIWDLAGTPVEVLEHRDAVTTLTFSPDQRWLATGSEDNTARLWDLEDPAGPSNRPLVLPHPGVVQEMAFSTGNNWLATGGPESAVRLFNLDDVGAGPVVLAGPVTALGFSVDEQWLAIGSDDGSARVWELENLSTRPIALIHVVENGLYKRAEVNTLAFSPDGLQLATGTSDKTARLWGLNNVDADPMVLHHPAVEDFEEAEVEALDFSPDGRWMATGSGDRRVRLFDLDDPAAEPHVLKQAAAVNALAFSPDGRWLAVAIKDDIPLLFDVADPAIEPIELAGHKDDVTSVAFSPDGRWLATGSRDGMVLLRRSDDPHADPRRIEAHEDEVTSLAFSPDGRRLATGSWDRTVRLWDLDSDRLINTFLHFVAVTDVAFRPDGNVVASATGDSVMLWDLTAPDPEDPVVNPVVLIDHSDLVNAVIFSPDGRWLATASEDETVRLWLQLDELVELGCESAGRNFTQDEWLDLLPDEPYTKTCEQWPRGP